MQHWCPIRALLQADGDTLPPKIGAETAVRSVIWDFVWIPFSEPIFSVQPSLYAVSGCVVQVFVPWLLGLHGQQVMHTNNYILTAAQEIWRACVNYCSKRRAGRYQHVP